MPLFSMRGEFSGYVLGCLLQLIAFCCFLFLAKPVYWLLCFLLVLVYISGPCFEDRDCSLVFYDCDKCIPSDISLKNFL